MSDIPFPHMASVQRANALESASGTDLDELNGWGNASPAAGTEETAVIPCWIQAKTQREQSHSAELGDHVSTHTVFCDVRTFAPGEFLVTVEGGGQEAGVRHRILGVRNPDGGEDHLELDTLVVARGT